MQIFAKLYRHLQIFARIYGYLQNIADNCIYKHQNCKVVNVLVHRPDDFLFLCKSLGKGYVRTFKI